VQLQKLSAEQQTAVKTSKAPSPVKPVGAISSQQGEPDAKDTKAWIAWRNKQVAML
jgi:hypothetical protein